MRKCLSMELVPTVAPSIPLLVGVGALLLVIGVGLKFMTYGPELNSWGGRISNYGVMAIALGIVLWLLVWFSQA